MSELDINFDDLTPRETKVSWRGEKYILQEASEGASVDHRNATIRIAKFSEAGKVVGVKDPADLEPLFVAKCLFKTDEVGSVLLSSSKMPVNVELAVINKMPARLVKKMFDWIKVNSNMDELDTEEKIQDAIIDLNKRLEEMRKEKYPTEPITDTSN